jgi:hypothetical protein
VRSPSRFNRQFFFSRNHFGANKLEILEFQASTQPYWYSVILANSGFGSIFVSQFVIDWQKGSSTYPVSKLVQVNSFETVESKPTNETGVWSYVANTSGVPTAENAAT